MTTGEIMLRFGKGLGANAVAMGALTALGFALPKKASEGLNVVMNAAAVAAACRGLPAITDAAALPSHPVARCAKLVSSRT